MSHIPPNSIIIKIQGVIIIIKSIEMQRRGTFNSYALDKIAKVHCVYFVHSVNFVQSVQNIYLATLIQYFAIYILRLS